MSIHGVPPLDTPTFPKPRQSVNFFWVFFLAWQLNRPKKTCLFCRDALLIDVDNAKAHYRLGLARHKLGESQQALQSLLRARRLCPNDPSIAKAILEVPFVARRNFGLLILCRFHAFLVIFLVYPVSIRFVRQLVTFKKSVIFFAVKMLSFFFPGLPVSLRFVRQLFHSLYI